MTLLERVQAVEGARRHEDAEREKMGIEALRAAVGTIVALDRIALIRDQSPERARNEIRAACRVL